MFAYNLLKQKTKTKKHETMNKQTIQDSRGILFGPSMESLLAVEEEEFEGEISILLPLRLQGRVHRRRQMQHHGARNGRIRGAQERLHVTGGEMWCRGKGREDTERVGGGRDGREEGT